VRTCHVAWWNVRTCSIKRMPWRWCGQTHSYSFVSQDRPARLGDRADEDGPGPDLLGVCEVGNRVTRR